MKFFLPVQDPKIAEESYQNIKKTIETQTGWPGAITRSTTATVAKTYALRSEDPIR
jgi:hypothetical protein